MDLRVDYSIIRDFKNSWILFQKISLLLYYFILYFYIIHFHPTLPIHFSEEPRLWIPKIMYEKKKCGDSCRINVASCRKSKNSAPKVKQVVFPGISTFSIATLGWVIENMIWGSRTSIGHDLILLAASD